MHLETVVSATELCGEISADTILSPGSVRVLAASGAALAAREPRGNPAAGRSFHNRNSHCLLKVKYVSLENYHRESKMQQKTELLMINCGITAAGFSVLAERGSRPLPTLRRFLMNRFESLPMSSNRQHAAIPFVSGAHQAGGLGAARNAPPLISPNINTH